MIIFLLIGGVSVKADNEEVKYTTETMKNYDGSIKVNLTNMNLDTTHNYVFGISSEESVEPSQYDDIEEITTETATILLDSSIDNIKNASKEEIMSLGLSEDLALSIINHLNS